ncbi:MBL fold metallo-hydrolase [Aliterella atlantica]|uniref:Zn-dependent hydrolase n=1 Tax=Aliterella atlantica CENA595 TaxID=1618023 RepID=A0A0D8ZPJ2_9CYAN|nr:MBL fold metallo-hydrolase [Aliterella atlantica]KJH70419.1 Zn-dependent hydrolase [Aliterella atlantica CENA595]
MKRRQILSGAGAGLVTTLFTQAALAQKGGSLSVQWLGHTCFLFSGNNSRILVNPFQPIGCTAKYRPPKVQAGAVLISSQLLDEGAVEGLPGKPRIIYEPGVYRYNNIQIQGIATDHDRQGGRRFGTNVVWRWNQGGINIVHLGGAAAPITIEQKILMGRPDVLFVPVGGGAKAYNPEEAVQAVRELNPKLVVPTHYSTQAADASKCDLVPVDRFLELMQGTPVRRASSDTITINSGNLPPKGMAIQVMSYKF